MIKLDFNPDRNALRQFAWIALVGLPLLVYVVLKIVGVASWTHPAMYVAYGVAVGQLVLLLAGVPILARVLFVALTLVAFPIGMIVSTVLVAFVYYLVLTPIGLFFRLIGRDLMHKKPDRACKSYWVERDGERPADSYFKLY
ncbi:MAG TPA: hypothetical protein ENI87_09225 [bacterium]|nr:hypothetical protein [bacterium]